MPKIGFITCACQYPCNPTGINNNHDPGEGNGKKFRGNMQKLFYKMKGKRTKIQLGNYTDFTNCNSHLHVW